MQKLNGPKREERYVLERLTDETMWGTHNAHDPASIKVGDWYYVFSTDAAHGHHINGGIQVRRSLDLIHWEYVGLALEELPHEAVEWTGAPGLWAPEVVFMGGRYVMYYAASQFGQTQSYIGVASAETIDGPWQDHRLVVKSEAGTSGPNAIDPNITFDAQGEPWLVYGSFFGGLYVFPVDPETGKKRPGSEETLIAKRHQSVEGAIEGPYIVYREADHHYYLFVSYDSLFKDYHIRVARSTSITGPYVDFDGNVMTDLEIDPQQVGMKILGGYRFGAGEGWVGPGHNSVLQDGDKDYLVHHVRGEQDPHWHELHIRKIIWTESGWPLVSPQRYAGEEERSIEMEELVGEWEWIYMDRTKHGVLPSSKIELLGDGTFVTEDGERGRYEKLTDTTIKLYGPEGITWHVLPGWDWENWRETLVFAGLSDQGRVFIGKQL